MGGEKSPVLSVAGFPTGSPPRGRGKVQFGIHALGGVGITPAWAGKSLPVVVLTEIFQDHPRVGGEKGQRRRWRLLPRGSPPRGRGKGGIGIYKTFTHGITPAWAGKSILHIHSYLLEGDHPRVGGEKILFKRARASILGSPPRGRGKEPSQHGL